LGEHALQHGQDEIQENAFNCQCTCTYITQKEIAQKQDRCEQQTKAPTNALVIFAFANFKKEI
jgi:hypothetical protein